MSADDHGRRSTYVRYGCRCEDCRDANRRYQNDANAKRAQRAAADPERVPHGTTGGYQNHGCRCSRCAEAQRMAHRQWRSKP